MACNREPVGRARLGIVALVLAAALVLVACADDGNGDDASPAGSTRAPSPGVIQGMVREPPLEVGEIVVSEVDAEGNETDFQFRAQEGGLLLVAFGYTHCPDVCPTTLSEFRTAVRNLGEDGDRIDVAFFTVDPNRDTPDVLNQYLGSFFPGGHALYSADFKALRVAEKAFAVTSTIRLDREGRTVVAHTARSFVVDDTGAVVVEWAFGVGSDVMTDDLQLLLDRT